MSTKMESQKNDFLYTMLQSMQLPISCWNAKNELIYASESLLQIFNCKSVEEFFDKHHTFSPKYQPDGTLSSVSRKRLMRQSLQEGASSFIWTHVLPGGQEFVVAYKVSQTTYAGEIITIMQLTESRDLINSIEKQFEANKRAKAMIDATPMGICYWSKDFQLVDCNQVMLDLLKIEKKESFISDYNRYRPDIQPDGQDSNSAAKEALAIAYEQGTHQVYWTHTDSLGESIPVLVTIKKVKMGDEYVIIEYTQDLRELRASQQETFAAIERNQIMLDTMPLGANFWNKNFQNIASNMAAAKLFDLKNSEEYLEQFFNLSPEFQPDGKSSATAAHEYIQLAFDTGHCKFEWLHQKPNGTPIPCEVTLIRQQYLGEDIVLGYTQDLRELKASQKLAQEAEERSTVILETMPLSVAFWNEECELFYCNTAAMKLFKLDNEELALTRFKELSPEFQPDGQRSEDKTQAVIAHVFKHGNLRFEWLHQDLQGNAIPVEITLVRANYRGEDIAVAYLRDLTELKASQEKAEEAIERNQTMLDTMPLCANFWSRDLVNLACNAEAPRLFDLKNQQEYLDRFMELSPEIQPCGEKSGDLAVKNIHQAFSEGRTTFEWMHQKLDGTPMPCEITLIRSNIRGEDVVVGYTRDLREIKASQAQAEEAIERNQTMLDTMPLCANFWSKNLENLACNAEAPRLFELKDEQEYLDRFFELSPELQPNGESSAKLAAQNIKIAFEEGQCIFEWMHQKLDGTPMPCEITLIRTELRGEEVVAGFTRDLRQIKASQELAQEAEHRSQLMLDSFPMGANFWSAELGLVDCNMEVAKLYGYTSKEEYMANFAKVLPSFQPDGRPSIEVVRDWLQKALQSGHERFEFECVMPLTQEPMPVEVTIERILHKGAFGAISYVRDLREFKAMLKEIHAAEEDLRKAKDVAEQSAKAKSEFLANMSHEIRTPMNGILGLLHLLNSTPLQADQKNYVHKTLFSANNLLRIINDILDFSKIEAGKLEIEATPFTLEQIFREVYDLYAVPSKEKGLRLHTNTHDTGTQILLGDPLRLKQILFNLTSNAIKFTHEGSIHLEVEALECTQDSVQCRFSCKDSGIGLSQSQMDRLFSAFSQADSSVTRKYGGTGLGLAISQNLAHMMQGDMWVESVEGEGTTFFFTAIFGIGHDVVQPEDTAQNNAQGQEQLGVGNLLLVEDNEINQLIAEELLRSVGYTVDTANNGQEAIDMLQAKTYDLVLMDIQMPVMDGLTASKTIRTMDAFKHIPIVAMSAHAMTGDKEISLAHGMNDHITKPIVPETLFSALQYWLGVSRQQKNDALEK